MKKKITLDNNLEEKTAQQIQSESDEALFKNTGRNEQMERLIKDMTKDGNKKSPPRLSFTEPIVNTSNYSGLYKEKKDLLPDLTIKKIRIENALVAAILRTRGNMLSMMGRVRRDRFDIGCKIEIKKEFVDYIEPEQMVVVQERINKLTKMFINCGSIDGVKESERTALAEFLYTQTINQLSFGRMATEFILNEDGTIHRFRPADAGTIRKTVKKGENADTVRKQSIQLLEQIQGEKLQVKKFESDEYAYVQLVDNVPRQAFTDEEMVVSSFYPCTDIELNGYPVSPLDSVIQSLTMYLSIETYNRLYFQNGKAARGMLVINSDNLDQSNLEDIKQQFNASINNVQNAFRTPIMGVQEDDAVQWVSTGGATKTDFEFQFLYDATIRNILLSFSMSPDELPAYSYLSRGINQSSLSESGNEFKLTSARDSGIRPLILSWELFFNQVIFNRLDPELAQLCFFSLEGFDAESKEQEAQRITQEQSVHMTYDEIMHEVDKDQIGKHVGGAVPFNPMIQQIMDKYVDTGKVIANFTDNSAAAIDPILYYKCNPFYFQNLQLMLQVNPAAVQAYFATRSDSFKNLKMLLQDYLDDQED